MDTVQTVLAFGLIAFFPPTALLVAGGLLYASAPLIVLAIATGINFYKRFSAYLPPLLAVSSHRQHCCLSDQPSLASGSGSCRARMSPSFRYIKGPALATFKMLKKWAPFTNFVVADPPRPSILLITWWWLLPRHGRLLIGCRRSKGLASPVEAAAGRTVAAVLTLSAGRCK